MYRDYHIPMFRLLLISLFLAGCLALTAQTSEEEVIRLKNSGTAGGGEVSQQSEQQVPQYRTGKTRIPGAWNLSAGTNFSYFPGYGPGIGFYATPVYSVGLTERWSLHGGMMVSSFSPVSHNTDPLRLQNPPAFTSLAVFAAASYRMTENLTLHGSGMRHFSPGASTRATSFSLNDVSMGATLKLGNNVSIGASIRMLKGYGHYFSPPIVGSPLGSPYSYPFGSRYLW